MNDKIASKSRSDDVPPIDAKFIHDATKELVGRQLRTGQNPVMRSNGELELVVRAEPNEVLSYAIVDRQGFPVDEIVELRVVQPSARKTTCWECGKDANGDTHCWKIPCPVITGPWTPEKVIEFGFVLL